MTRIWTIIGVNNVPTSFRWYQLDDFDRALHGARALVSRFEEEPHVNPNTHTPEFSLRDPDGYDVTISALCATRGPGANAARLNATPSGREETRSPARGNLVRCEPGRLGDVLGLAGSIGCGRLVADTILGNRPIRMAQIIARAAGPSDVPHLVDLMQEFYAESAFPLDRGWATQAFAYLMAHPVHGAAWLIERDGTPIGHVVLSVRLTMEFGGLSGYIDDLFVRAAYRRIGGATAGLDAVLSECRRRGCRSLHVEVGADNEPALALYHRYGLRPGTDGRQMLHRVLEAAG